LIRQNVPIADYVLENVHQIVLNLILKIIQNILTGKKSFVEHVSIVWRYARRVHYLLAV